MPTINNLRQQAATIKNATQVGENTATRVGTTFETIADLLEGMGGVTNLSTIDIGSIDTLNTTGDMLVGTPNIYTLTKTIGANTFKVGTLFQFANNGRYDVAQVIVSQFIVDADGRIDTTSADQEVHIFYRLCKTMNGGTLPTPIGTWTTWTELGGSGGSGVTIDPYPTQNSGNAVSSGGVFERLQDVAPKVDISAIDDIDEYSDMLAGVSPFYVVTKTLSGNVFRIGTLMEFANQGRYILYQILATDYVLNDDGTLDTTTSENGGLKLIWRMKQFSGNPPAGVTIGVWSTWSYLSGGGAQPDNEDIDLNADDQLQFANKSYDASAFSGLGRVYLRKNIVTSGGVEKNVLTQAMVNTANTIYHIQYDYDLNGQTITIPSSSYLQFDGGRLTNGVVRGNFANTEFNVKDFGAIGDGATDDTNAIKNALASIAYSTTNTRYILYFPKGEYLITESNVFASFSATNVRSMLVRGDSQFTSRLILVGDNETEKWFYDNKSLVDDEHANDRRKVAKLYFEHISIETDDPLHCNGFKVWSNGHDKQFRFLDCYIAIGTFFYAQGTANADLTIVDKCDIMVVKVLETHNSQSVAHRFTNCNITCACGAVDNVYGGNIWFSNCSIEMHKTLTLFRYGRFNTAGYDEAYNVNAYESVAEPFYLVTSSGESGIGGNAGITFTTCRFELHDSSAYANISKQSKLSFVNCCLATYPTGIIASKITDTASLTLTGCVISSKITFGIGGTNLLGATPPSLIIENCNLNRNTPSTIYQLDATSAKISVRDCYNGNDGDGSSYKMLNIDYGEQFNNGCNCFTSNIKVVGALSTYTNGFQSTSRLDTLFYLPATNKFLGFGIHKKPAATSGQSCKFKVTGIKNDDTSVVLWETIDAIEKSDEFVFRYDCFFVDTFKQIKIEKSSNIAVGEFTFVGFYI